jgi:hypothetical protein
MIVCTRFANLPTESTRGEGNRPMSINTESGHARLGSLLTKHKRAGKPLTTPRGCVPAHGIPAGQATGGQDRTYV